MHELVYRLIGWLYYVNQALMSLDHKIFATVAVDKRGFGNIEMLLIGRKRYWTYDARTRTNGRIQYLLTTVINDPAVIRF